MRRANLTACGALCFGQNPDRASPLTEAQCRWLTGSSRSPVPRAASNIDLVLHLAVFDASTMPINSHSAPRKIVRKQRIDEALQYRLAGASFPQIAKQMKIAVSTAFSYVAEGMEAIPLENAKQVLAQELARLDRLFAAHIRAANAGDTILPYIPATPFPSVRSSSAATGCDSSAYYPGRPENYPGI
jgi:hypothetical protein